MYLSIFLQRVLTSLMLVFLFVVIFFYCSPIWMSLTLSLILIYILMVEWPKLVTVLSPRGFIFTLFYPVLPFILLIDLNQSPQTHDLVLYLMLLVATHDVGSYIIGKLFGQHRIAPSISPKKTWEGFVGGYFSTLAITMILSHLGYIHAMSMSIVCIFILILCTLALLGDLFESYFKRQAHIKDSGNILPGHGGFLDRFDAILFVTYLFYLLKDWLILILAPINL